MFTGCYRDFRLLRFKVGSRSFKVMFYAPDK